MSAVFKLRLTTIASSNSPNSRYGQRSSYISPLCQNAYAWKLINELGNRIGIAKDDLYFQMLKDYGQSIIVSLLDEVNPEHYFKYYELIGRGKTNNKGFSHYRVYKGSSEFNTLEMKYFLDGIIQECENVGIPTLTSDEIERMRLV